MSITNPTIQVKEHQTPVLRFCDIGDAGLTILSNIPAGSTTPSGTTQVNDTLPKNEGVAAMSVLEQSEDAQPTIADVMDELDLPDEDSDGVDPYTAIPSAFDIDPGIHCDSDFLRDHLRSHPVTSGVVTSNTAAPKKRVHIAVAKSFNGVDDLDTF